MGNVLRCLQEGEDDHGGRDRYPFYRPTSGTTIVLQARDVPAAAPSPTHRRQTLLGPHGLQAGTVDEPAAAPSPTRRRQTLPGPHGFTPANAGVSTAWDQHIVNFKSTSMAAAPNFGHLQGSTTEEDIDELEEVLGSSEYVFVYHGKSSDEPAAAPSPTHHRQILVGPHGFTAGVAARDQRIVNFKSTSVAAAPTFRHLQGSSEVRRGEKVVAPPPRHQYNGTTTTEEYIDESSAAGLCDAASYVKAKAMLIQVPVLGTTKTFWRLSDEAAMISRNLALILRSHHAVGRYLAAPLQVSDVCVGLSSGTVKLRGVRFSGGKRVCMERLRRDYKNLSRVLQELVRVSGGSVARLPPDYREFLALLESDVTMDDEFLIVNNPALLPMSNRTEVFLMLYDRIVYYLGRSKPRKAKKKRILSKLPYNNDWLDTAMANAQINQWVTQVQKKYSKTQLDQLRLNRNVRSHLRQYNDDDIEEVLYCEWPELLVGMAKMLHLEGELQATHIQNKFGYCPAA